MFATGVTTVLIGIDTKPKFLENGCFTEVSKPAPGDLGFFILKAGGDDFYLHSFAYVDSGHVFHKANPGWDVNPFELIPVDVERSLMTLFADYSTTTLRWGHYAPTPDCFLFRFQDWINRHRVHSRFAAMIQTMEANAAGRPLPASGAPAFTKILRAVDQKLEGRTSVRTDSLEYPILQVMHEYLMLPQFAESRRSLTSQRLIEAKRILSMVRAALESASGVPAVMKEVLAKSSLSYQTASIALFDTSRVAYLGIPAADFDRLQDFSLTTGSMTIVSTNQRIEIKTPNGTWIFKFTS